jgi:hypothetical protein
LSSEKKSRRQIDARTAAVAAVVIVAVSAVAGVLLQQQKQVVPSKAADRATATVTATVTATAPATSSAPTDPAVLPENMRVAFTELCSFESVVVAGDCPADAGSAVGVDGHRFVYQEDTSGTNHPPGSWDDWIGFKNSDCTRLHLLFALDDQTSRRGDVAQVRVVRPSGTAHARAGRGTVGVLDAELDGHRKPFTLSSSATHSSDVYMRGYVVCPRPR